MAKVRKTFEFIYHLRKNRVFDLKIVTDILPLYILAEVSYDGGPIHDEDSYRLVDLHSVIYDGKNIMNVLYFTDQLEDIEAQAIAEAMELFSSNTKAA